MWWTCSCVIICMVNMFMCEYLYSEYVHVWVCGVWCVCIEHVHV